MMFLEEWSEIKAKDIFKSFAEAEPKYYFSKAKAQTALSEALTGYEVRNDDEREIICIYRVRS